MSDFTGPGRNSEMSTIRSSHRFGWSFCNSSRWPGDSIWKQPSVSESRIISKVSLVVERDPLEVDLLPHRPRDLIHRVAHRREHPHTEDVELQVAEQLDVVLVGLDHPVAVRGPLQRHPVDQVVGGQHDPAGMQRDVAREAVQTLGHAEQQLQLGHREVDPGELREARERLPEVPRRDVRERLRHHPDLDLRQAERLADLADRGARPIGVDHRDAAGALVAVAREDHVVDVLAPRGLDVDVDVRQLVAHRVQEAFEREVVTERVDVGDPQEVADEGAGGARAAARDVDPHRADVGRDVGHREEERRVAHLPDHRELEMQPVAEALVLGHPPVVDAGPAALGEDRVGAAPGRRREVREVDLLQPEVEPARLGDLQGRVAEVGPLGEQQTASPRPASAIPSAFVRETWFAAIGTISRMHSSASARNASSGTR